MNIKVITSSSIKTIEDVERLHLNTIEGEITILPRHYPLITAIDVSKITFIKGKDEKRYAFASNGILNVKESEVILLLNAFEFKEDIDVNRAESSKQRAEERINSKNEKIDMVRAEASLKRALLRIKIAQN